MEGGREGEGSRQERERGMASQRVGEKARGREREAGRERDGSRQYTGKKSSALRDSRRSSRGCCPRTCPASARFPASGLHHRVSVYLRRPIQRAQAMSRSKVDRFVPRTQHINLRIDREAPVSTGLKREPREPARGSRTIRFSCRLFVFGGSKPERSPKRTNLGMGIAT